MYASFLPPILLHFRCQLIERFLSICLAQVPPIALLVGLVLVDGKVNLPNRKTTDDEKQEAASFIKGNEAIVLLLETIVHWVL
jgi:hypothetical protein